MSILESFLAGKEARRMADAAEQVNAMQQFIGQNGAAIMGGDPNALGQLAGFGAEGLSMAMGVQGNVYDRQRQESADAALAEERAFNRERATVADDRAAQEWEMQLEEYKAGKTQAELEAAAAAIEAKTKTAMMQPTPEAFDAFVTENGMPELVGKFDQRETLGAQFMSMAEVLKAQTTEKPKPQTEVAQLKADFDAGLIDQATYEAEIARRAPRGTSVTVDPSGVVTYTDGPMAAGDGATAGDALRTQMTDAQSMVDLIDEIAKDPALSTVTGSWMGGGGNDVDQFGTARALAYGDEGMAVVQKIAQLQGNAWLAARALLKGGGPITDYESRKAEGAMARLSRRQGDEEFKAALADLQSAIESGLAKLESAKSGGETPASEPAPGGDLAVGTVDGGYKYIGGDPSLPTSWEAVK